MIYVLSFPPPAGLMNMNRRGSHWSENHGKKVDWRDGTMIHGVQAVNTRAIPKHLPFSIVSFGFPVNSLKLRRDPHNFYPTVKAAIDGLVKAGIFEDDSSRHLATTEPAFHLASENPNVIITINTKEDP